MFSRNPGENCEGFVKDLKTVKGLSEEVPGGFFKWIRGEIT